MHHRANTLQSVCVESLNAMCLELEFSVAMFAC